MVSKFVIQTTDGHQIQAAGFHVDSVGPVLQRVNCWDMPLSEPLKILRVADVEGEKLAEFLPRQWYEVTECKDLGEYKIQLIKWRPAPVESSSTVTQVIMGNVGYAAGRDIQIENMDVQIMLKALADSIDRSPGVPEAEKASLVVQLKRLMLNPYVSGVGSTAFFEAMRKLVGG